MRKGENRMKRLQLKTKWFLTLAVLLPMTTAALAGELDAPAPPSDPGSAMFTLEDLFNRLSNGTAGAKRSGAFVGPLATPGPTMRTLDQIMAKAPAPDGSAATAAEVVTGKTFWGLGTGNNWGARTGAMANVGAQNITPGTTSQAITQGYHNGSGAVAGEANLVTGNIKSGATIFGVSGDGNVVNTAEATDPAAAGNISSGKKAFVNGAPVTGTMADNGAQSITPGTASQTITQGYHNGSGTVAGDADLTAGNIKSGVNVFGVTGTFTTAIARRVNKTGQTECRDHYGVLIPCSGTGQDGEHQYGIDPAVGPTVGATGAYNSPASTGTRFLDNGNGTITDTLTALIWQKDSSCHDQKTWPLALTACNTLYAGSCGLNDGSSAGQWRLPNINELHSLGPSWPLSAPFIGNLASYYWSSTTYASGVYGAWDVDFGHGDVDGYDKSNYDYVRCVRGVQ
jgi:hypothetical protein